MIELIAQARFAFEAIGELRNRPRFIREAVARYIDARDGVEGARSPASALTGRAR